MCPTWVVHAYYETCSITMALGRLRSDMGYEPVPAERTRGQSGSGGVYLMSETEASRHPLVEARRLRRWSQEGLAALLQARGLGTSKTTVRRWQRCVTCSE